MTTTTRILPTHWACPLINGDYSGLSDDEAQELDDYLASEPTLAECIDVGEEHWFSHRNDAGTLAGDVAEYTFFEA